MRWRDNTTGKSLALHMPDLGSFPRTANQSLNPVSIIAKPGVTLSTSGHGPQTNKNPLNNNNLTKRNVSKY